MPPSKILGIIQRITETSKSRHPLQRIIVLCEEMGVISWFIPAYHCKSSKSSFQQNSLGAFAADFTRCFTTAGVSSSAPSPSHHCLKAVATTPLSLAFLFKGSHSTGQLQNQRKSTHQNLLHFYFLQTNAPSGSTTPRSLQGMHR